MNQKATDAKPTRKERINTGSAADEFSMAAALEAVFSKLHFFLCAKDWWTKNSAGGCHFPPEWLQSLESVGNRSNWWLPWTESSSTTLQSFPSSIQTLPMDSLPGVCDRSSFLANAPSAAPIYKGVESMRRPAKSWVKAEAANGISISQLHLSGTYHLLR